MKLQYFGHACFRIISEMGTTIVCDPYNSNMVGLEMPYVRCDVVTMSHHHDDHDCMQKVIGSPAEIDCEVACSADDIAVQSYETYHDDQGGKLRGKNLVFTFLVDGIRVAHLGDVGCLDENIVKKLDGCDVLMLPVGGTYTVDAQGAKWYVDKINPKVVIPMHYQFANSKIDVTSVQPFLQLFGDDQVKYVGDTLNILDDPQNTTPIVCVMQMFED